MKLDYETARLVDLARRSQSEWSWTKFVGWIVLLNVFCWMLFGCADGPPPKMCDYRSLANDPSLLIPCEESISSDDNRNAVSGVH